MSSCICCTGRQTTGNNLFPFYSTIYTKLTCLSVSLRTKSRISRIPKYQSNLYGYGPNLKPWSLEPILPFLHPPPSSLCSSPLSVCSPILLSQVLNVGFCCCKKNGMMPLSPKGIECLGSFRSYRNTVVIQLGMK